MSHLLFTAFSNRQDALDLARQSVEGLRAEGISSEVHLLDKGEPRVINEDTLVVSLGGDGTFLQSARLAHSHGARVLAVNLGRLGFLLNVPSNEIVESVNMALEHSNVVERLALSIFFDGSTA